MKLCSLPVIYLGPNYDGGNEDTGTSFKRSHACTLTVTARNPTAGHPPTHASTGDSWTLPGKFGSVSYGVTAPFPGSWCTQGYVCPPRVYFPVLCEFWQLCGGVNGDLLHEGFRHTQVCCSQSPCSCAHIPAGAYLNRGCSNTVLSQCLWGPWVLEHTRFCLSPLSISDGNGV